MELPLADFFLSKLVGRRSDVGVHHLASLDPVMYRNLLYLKNFEDDVSDLGLDFTVVNEELGETTVSAQVSPMHRLRIHFGAFHRRLPPFLKG